MCLCDNALYVVVCLLQANVQFSFCVGRVLLWRNVFFFLLTELRDLAKRAVEFPRHLSIGAAGTGRSLPQGSRCDPHTHCDTHTPRQQTHTHILTSTHTHTHTHDNTQSNGCRDSTRAGGGGSCPPSVPLPHHAPRGRPWRGHRHAVLEHGGHHAQAAV